MKYFATIEDQNFEIEISSDRELIADGVRLSVDFQSVMGRPVYSLLLNGRSYEAYVYPTESGMEVLLQGDLHQVDIEDERQRRLRKASTSVKVQSGEFQLKAPMPGLVISVPIEEGQGIEEGQNLIVLESMKMQNELKSPCTGTVTRIRVKTGDSVEKNEVLVILG